MPALAFNRNGYFDSFTHKILTDEAIDRESTFRTASKSVHDYKYTFAYSHFYCLKVFVSNGVSLKLDAMF